MTYEKIFSDIQKNFKKAKLSDFTREFAFQFNITGEGEGIFYAAYKNGVLSIEPYDYKDRDVIFTADGKTLTDIAAGKLEPIDAISAGKLSVDGNHELAKEIMLLINQNAKSSTKSAAEKKEAKPAAKETKKEKNQETAVKTEEKPAASKASVIVEAEAKAPEKSDEKKAASAPAASKTTAKAPAKTKGAKKGKRK